MTQNHKKSQQIWQKNSKNNRKNTKPLTLYEQLAVTEFSQAMLVIPKTLAINGGYDASDLVSKLRGYHYQSQHPSSDDPKKLEKLK